MSDSMVSKKGEESRKKFILFVGNLTFDTTNEDLKSFFEDTKPSSIRLMTDKITKKSKGFAFVEFTGSKYLETALAKDKQKIKGRKLNIELTAGGGGSKSEVRKERIKAKNEKFRQEKKTSDEAEESSSSPKTAKTGSRKSGSHKTFSTEVESQF